MTDHLTRHNKSSWKYVRAIPRDLRCLFETKNVTRYIGSITHAKARVRARELAVKDDVLFRTLRELPADRFQEIVAAGGVAKWKAPRRRRGRFHSLS